MSLNGFIRRYICREYRFWVINTPVEAKLYLWDNFKHLYPHVDALRKASNEAAFIRTFQSIEGKNGWLGFGRMRWSKENNEKWTKKYRGTKKDSETIIFHETQIWAPDWNRHADTGVPPEIFVKIYNFNNSDTIREGMVVAVLDRIYRKHTEGIDAAIYEIVNTIPESTLSVSLRGWGPGKGFVNQIQDINNWEITQVINNT